MKPQFSRKSLLGLFFVLLLTGVGAFILYRFQTGQNLIPGFAGTNDTWLQVENTDARLKFVSGPERAASGYPTWDKVTNSGDYVLRGGSASQCNGLNSVGCYVEFDLTQQNFSIDQIKLGFSRGPNRTSADIYVDGKKLAEVDSNSGSYVLNYNNYTPYVSPEGAIPCGKHIIKIVPNQRTGTGQKTFTLDYFDIKTCTPSGGSGGTATWQKIENSDTRFDYGGNNPSRPGFPYWDLHTESGGYVLSGDTAHACRTDQSLGCVAKLNLSSGNVNFKAVRIGFTEGANRTSADIFIDNQKIGEADSYNTKDIINFSNYELWTSPVFSCGKHEIKIVPNGRTGTNAKSFDMDFLEIQTCTPGADDNDNPTTGKTCSKDSDCVEGKMCTLDAKKCRPIDKRHLGCFQNSCAWLNKGGDNTDGCRKAGGPCGGGSAGGLQCKNYACVLNENAATDDAACDGKDVDDECGKPSSGFLVCRNNACALDYGVNANDAACDGQEAGDGCGQTGSYLLCKNNACTVSTTASSSDVACDGKSAGASCGSSTGNHLICKNFACELSATAASDDTSCLGKSSGATCGSAAADDDCQGNPDASAKCFDCKRDTTTLSQVNNLDFSCFAKYYDADVGTE